MAAARLGSVLGVLLISACLVPAGPPLPAPPGREPPPPTLPVIAQSAIADAVLVESNRARAREGLPALVANERLRVAAQQHADELAQRRVLDHRSTQAGRETLAQRINAVGVEWRRIAENLAKLPVAPEHVAEDAVHLWLNSPGHRSNLLHNDVFETGVGIARDDRRQWYVVQVYVRSAAELP